MTTFEAVVIGWRAASEAKKRARAERRARAATGLARARRPLLTISALGAITAAAFTVGLGVGLLATGVALFVLEGLSGSD